MKKKVTQLKNIFRTWNKKDPNWKYRNDKFPCPENIYGHEGEFGGYVRKFHLVHFVFKYKLIVPLIKILKLFSKKAIVSTPDKPWNKNFQILDEAFELALDDWTVHYKYRNQRVSKKVLKEARTDGSSKLLRDIYKLFKIIPLWDSAYREFLNCMMFRITILMNEKYNEERPIHIMYSDKAINSVKYMSSFQAMEEVDLYRFMQTKKVVILNPPEELTERINKVITDYKNETKTETKECNKEVPGTK